MISFSNLTAILTPESTITSMKKNYFFFLLSLLAHISFAAVNAEDEAIQLAQNLPEMTKSFISRLVIMLNDGKLGRACISGSPDAEFGRFFLTEIKKFYENKGFDFPTLSTRSDRNLITIREVIKEVKFTFLIYQIWID